MSKPRASLVTTPGLEARAEIVFGHFLHDDRPDLAYSAIIFADEEDAIFEENNGEIVVELGLLVTVRK